MEELFTLEYGAAFLTLTILEIVLGIDNVVFIAILAGKVKEEQQANARRVGLLLAMVARIILLFGITWIMGLQSTLFELMQFEVSGRDLVLMAGGLFLIYKATTEIHDKLEGSHETIHQPQSSARFSSVMVQIVMLDSVITAVGMVKQESDGTWQPIVVMCAAIIVAIMVMLAFSGPIANFIQRHPTTKMLALSFLLMIGLVLVAEGFHQHIEKGYVYSAMAFSVFVEVLNLRVKKIRRKRAEAKQAKAESSG